MTDTGLFSKFTITDEDLANTPPKILARLAALLIEEVTPLRKRAKELEARLNRN